MAVNNFGDFVNFNAGHSPSLNATFYQRTPMATLEIQKGDMPYLELGWKVTLPKHYGDTYVLQDWQQVSPWTTSLLNKGDTSSGDPISLQASAISLEINMYGKYGEIQDALDQFQFVDYANKLQKELYRSAWQTINDLNREKMYEKGSIFVAGHPGSTDIEDLTATDIVNIFEVVAIGLSMANNTVAVYDSNKAGAGYGTSSVEVAAPLYGFGPQKRYKFFTSADSFLTIITKDSIFKQITYLGHTNEFGKNNYTAAGSTYDFMNLEIIIVPSTEIRTQATATLSLTESSLIVSCGSSNTVNGGKGDVFARVMLEGTSEIETIFKPMGSAGTADALNRKATMGAKFYYGSDVIRPAGIASYTFVPDSFGSAPIS